MHNSIASCFYQRKKVYTYRFNSVFLLQEYELWKTPWSCCDLQAMLIKCSLTVFSKIRMLIKMF